MKKIIRFMGSMKFAMILLGILAAACAAGSFVQQGKTYTWYSGVYGERVAAFIVALHLDDAFHSWWFVVITAFLCLNLLLCNIVRFPSLYRRWKESDQFDTIRSKAPLGSALISSSPEKLFEAMHFRKIGKYTDEEGRRFFYSSRGNPGIWGAWVCHFGVLLLILGFALGQSLKEEYSIYGVPGQTREVEGTDYLVTIDDFRMDLREDNTIRQYTADLTVRDASTGEAESGSASVNNPASMFGMKFYQNSTGWAASVTVEKDGEELQKDVLCAGEFIPVKEKPELVIYLNAFYPDYVLSGGEPATLSQEINNPGYLYTVYYQGSVIGMNVLTGDEVITIDDYTVRFSDPQTYTLIQIKRDRFTILALIGGLLTLAGLALALLVWPASLWAEEKEDGSFMVSAECRKGGQLFLEEFEEACKKTTCKEDTERT